MRYASFSAPVFIGLSLPYFILFPTFQRKGETTLSDKAPNKASCFSWGKMGKAPCRSTV
jgi:hypothetical protein